MDRLEELDKLIAEDDVKIAAANLRLEALIRKNDERKNERRKICPHPEDKRKRISDYYEGTYNDRAMTQHRITCERCGAVLKSWTETHSWYG